MAHKLFQGVLTNMKAGLSREVGICDNTGAVIACTLPEHLGSVMSYPVPLTKLTISSGRVFLPVVTKNSDEYTVFVQGEDDLAMQLVSVVAVSVANIKQLYDDKYDRSNFIKNVVTDNILPGDIYAKARELQFVGDVSRVVLLVRTHNNYDGFPYEAISALFPEKQKDFVFNVSELDTVIVKEVRANIESADMDKLASSIVDTLSTAHFIKATVGIGTPVSALKDLANSFKEAQTALEIGRVFESERTIINYSKLGIARLIYQLPTTLCDMYLREVFSLGDVDCLDDETLFTIQRFFENNLNVSETSRGLFVHRNTLVYRLEKIKKLTGLDLREFDDAILFRVALMVKRYLSVAGN